METDPGAAQISAQILLLIALTIMNAFFSGAEMAVVSVNKNRIRMLADSGNKKSNFDSKAFRRLYGIFINHPGSNYICRILFKCFSGNWNFPGSGGEALLTWSTL